MASPQTAFGKRRYVAQSNTLALATAPSASTTPTSSPERSVSRSAPQRSALTHYATYNFVDKDPVIDELRTLIADEGVTYRFIETKSGVTTTTLRAWFGGKTRKPQHATICAVAGALGYEMRFARKVSSK
jgi:hypothetical protein